ncbi:MAG: flagellar hook-associated protein FlgL [Candidatus Contendobacter sp.]|nr:flagellar hook-associated protein FlgL [Candidatus Contendobacter sp.]
MLRIATTQLYQQAAKTMGDRQTALFKVQQQMATGNRLLTNSDDPVGSARMLGLNEELGRYDQYQRNTGLANSRLNVEETTLEGVGQTLQNVRELIVQANNAPLNDSDRRDIATQIRQFHAQLVGLANTQDGNGEYLFSGFQSHTQPFVPNIVTPSQIDYQGDQGQRLIKAGPGLDVPVSDSGFDVFQNVPAGNGSFSVAAAATNTGTGIIDLGSVTNSTVFLNHNYTIAFSSPPTTFTVTDNTIGSSVSPPSPAVSWSYVDGQAIQFDGLQTAISGAPVALDTFTIQSGAKQDLFTTLDKLATALEAGSSTPTQLTQFNDAMATGLSELDQGLDHLTGIRAKIGGRMNALDDQQNTNGDFAVHLKQTIGEIGDLDYAEAATRLSRETLVLQAAQQSFVKIQGLSLFNYMR